MRFRPLGLSVFALSLLASITTAHAQGILSFSTEADPRGFRLIMRSAVRKALSLTKEQDSELTTMLEKDVSERFQRIDGNDPSKIKARKEKFDSDVARILDEKQEKRLRELAVQILGAILITNDEFADQLGLSVEQKKSAKDIHAATKQSLRKALTAYRDTHEGLNLVEIKEIGDNLEKAEKVKLKALLTISQQELLKRMEGEAADLEESKNLVVS